MAGHSRWAKVKHLIAAAGAVSRLFNRKGQLIVSRDAANEDVLMELALEGILPRRRFAGES
jgi:transcriptional/translational regulatory protein YebC/TACO1